MRIAHGMAAVIGVVCLIWSGCSTPSPDSGEPVVKVVATPAPQQVKLEDLLTAELEGVADTEVIVSRVSIPPNTSLPKHWHPGEEFGYVLEGTVTLWQQDKADIVCRAGEVVKIPLKQVHTAVTTAEGATILVFRVHEKGKPARHLVE